MATVVAKFRTKKEKCITASENRRYLSVDVVVDKLVEWRRRRRRCHCSSRTISKQLL